jgi:hypothetical protein
MNAINRNRFQPTFDTLEARDVPSTCMGDALPIITHAVGDTAHVAQLDPALGAGQKAGAAVGAQQLATGQPALDLPPFDIAKVADKVKALFDKNIVKDGWNIWFIQQVFVDKAWTEKDGNGDMWAKVVLGVDTVKRDFITLSYKYITTDPTNGVAHLELKHIEHDAIFVGLDSVIRDRMGWVQVNTKVSHDLAGQELPGSTGTSDRPGLGRERTAGTWVARPYRPDVAVIDTYFLRPAHQTNAASEGATNDIAFISSGQRGQEGW